MRAFAGVTIWGTVQNISQDHTLTIVEVDGSCEWGARLQCAATQGAVTATALWASVACIYFVAYYACIIYVRIQLRRRLYQKFRMAHQALQIQARTFHHVLLVVR